jgi:hypothetical protein
MAEEKEGRKVLGEGLTFEERVSLAQLTNQTGWKILVKLMAEECRRATEAVIKLDPSADRYDQKLVGLQTTARAMNVFSASLLDSVRVHLHTATEEVKQRENTTVSTEPVNRFRLPIVPTDAK